MNRSPAAFVLVSFLACFLVRPCPAVEGEFVPLFDGKSLEGWVQHGGKAEYTIEDNAIVGTSVADTPNSFLCPPREYGDFILELELKVANELNSGIQIRSHVFEEPIEFNGKKIAAGRFHGYQVEIDPTDRAFSGGIYDEGRRGWLYKPEGDEQREARQAFKRDQWNKYRIEARGHAIKTWINGVQVADLTDDVDARGFIGLQVHGVPDKFAGKQVRWRNLRICDLGAESE